MKQQAIQYVALDVHQATLVVNVPHEQGTTVMRATVATEAKAIVGLVRGLGARVHIAVEEGTQAQSLHDVLTKHAERGGRLQYARTRGDQQQERPGRRRPALQTAALRGAEAGVPPCGRVLTLKELVRSYVALSKMPRACCSASRRCTWYHGAIRYDADREAKDTA